MGLTEPSVRLRGRKMAKEKSIIRSSAAEYLTYVASTGDSQESIEMRYEDENIWLTQKMMATLYGVGLPAINEHIKKIYSDSELSEDATIRKFRIVQTDYRSVFGSVLTGSVALSCRRTHLHFFRRMESFTLQQANRCFPSVLLL